MNLAIGLIHNKNPATNRNQITALTALVERHVLNLAGQEFDPTTQDDVGISRVYYTIAGLSVPHEAIFFQVVPTGVNPPNNLYNLDSYKVFYSPNDNADKTGSHPRFWNWTLKRGFDYGADISCVITDHSLFTVAGLQLQIGRLIDRRVLVVPLWGLAASARLFREVGQLREDLGFSGALDDLRARIIARGLEHG
ncbi:MAG: hypothetical protein UY48_C0001G0019 [Candidatus Gottesmanbacteria bacterium GW2011_GWB1_49_7]|uniref:Uncharacterized protein n=1 Tax=Candidatus Gottesmanbacteria bacterium GW2011_GWB1_49_7 TaxID=1618448 RepID=A0A0G1W3W1_9BACT|nr:MAG: hypothetical protein UY48_C0001G0019 [Candidatus Gottesmanbacteria bacterium GW2011_GWB1_49_7]